MNLMERFYELSKREEVKDVWVYAQEFRQLAADFRAENRLSMSYLCDAKAAQYEKLSFFLPNFIRVECDDYNMLTPDRAIQ